MRISILILAILSTSLTALAQWQVAMINDPGGYVNIRKGVGDTFNQNGRIDSNELFMCMDSSSARWKKVVYINRDNGDTIIGFIDSSRVKFYHKLTYSEKRGILLNVLVNQADHTKRLFYSRNKGKPPSTSTGTTSFNGNYKSVLAWSYDFQLIAGGVLDNFICTYNDTSIVKNLLQVFRYDNNSPDMQPSIALARCFICNPELVLYCIEGIASERVRAIIYNHIELGLKNVLDIKDAGASENQMYIRLMKKLESVWD